LHHFDHPMGSGLRHLKKEVHYKVKESIVKDMLKYMSEHDLKLQGIEKGRKSFEEVYACLFKYIKDIGFNKLWSDVSKIHDKKVGFIPESSRTLRINIQKIRQSLKFWAGNHVYVRSEEVYQFSSTLKVRNFPVLMCRNFEITKQK
jgi:hypothetical protein